MSFLSPWTIAWAAGLTVPPLVALYFLKLRRNVELVPSTLLWRKAVEDLRVNAPFQRLRSSLLLLLQLLLLVLAALALGKPMMQVIASQEETVILLVDQSASMAVIEANGRSRLARAKEEAKRVVENMDDRARAMVIAFCDRATVVSSFDTDRRALGRKIDSIEQTQSLSTLSEAISLAEAYAQNQIIGGEEAGADKAPEATASPATVFLFTDGRLADADRVALQHFDVSSITVMNVGKRDDNVGIVAMDARRNYEQPEILEVTAVIENFGAEAVTTDAVLYVDGRNVDIQTVELSASAGRNGAQGSGTTIDDADRSAVVVFDAIEFGGGGVIEVALRVEDALPTDNRAWAIVQDPRRLKVLLVTSGDPFLQGALEALPLDLETLTGDQYERVDEARLVAGRRSAFDVVVLDRHSTSRLPQGNYFFWGAVPQVHGVSAGSTINDQVIFNWDETHPVLRHVAVEALYVYEWLDLTLPPEAVSLIEGETSSVLAYLTRDASQYLISAFSLTVQDERGEPQYNTFWMTTVDFVLFMQNAVGFLASNVSTSGMRSLTPGQPVAMAVPEEATTVTVRRPDGSSDVIPTAGHHSIHYARTRRVGVYEVAPAVNAAFAVNLFDAVESRVAPARSVTLGARRLEAQSGSVEVNRPAWPWLLGAILAVLILEWTVYNKRVFI